MAKRIVFCLVLVAMCLPGLVGCGVGSTVEDNNRAISRTWDLDARMLTDDLGELVLAERPFRGSKHPIK